MQIWLKKKGLASANKKANRIAAEGVIETYIHAGANLGVLIEVNCETDFVAKGSTFKELAENLAMQVLLVWFVSSVAPCHAHPRASPPNHNFEALGFLLSFVQI
jgi:elongation factor Ts